MDASGTQGPISHLVGIYITTWFPRYKREADENFELTMSLSHNLPAAMTSKSFNPPPPPQIGPIDTTTPEGPDPCYYASSMDGAERLVLASVGLASDTMAYSCVIEKTASLSGLNSHCIA